MLSGIISHLISIGFTVCLVFKSDPSTYSQLVLGWMLNTSHVNLVLLLKCSTHVQQTQQLAFSVLTPLIFLITLQIIPTITIHYFNNNRKENYLTFSIF